MRRSVYEGYIGGSLVRGMRVARRCCGSHRVADTYDGLFDTYDGLFDFVMSHYAYDVTRLRSGQRYKLIGDVMVFDDESAYYM